MVPRRRGWIPSCSGLCVTCRSRTVAAPRGEVNKMDAVGGGCLPGPFGSEAAGSAAGTVLSCQALCPTTSGASSCLPRDRVPLKSSDIQGLTAEGPHARQSLEQVQSPEVESGVRKVSQGAKCTVAGVMGARHHEVSEPGRDRPRGPRLATRASWISL